MKLLYITNAINGSGGLERVLSVKTAYLAEQLGYDVHMLTLNNGHNGLFYDFSDKIGLHDILVSGNPFSYIKSYFSGIRKTINEVKPDVIVVCDDGLKAFFLPTVLGTKIPIVYERHVSKNIEIGKNFGIWKLISAKCKLLLMDLLGGSFSRFIVLTSGNTKEWKHKNIQIIPNLLPFYTGASAALLHKKVIAVGKQSYQKGYDRLLKSWQLVQQKNPDWQLEIYGKFDASQQLELLANHLGVAKSVRFFEPETAIMERYLDSSIYVMSSRFEGFGMVLIEAMACGVPCVSFDCPHGPADIITNGKDGFLVPNGNTDALAERLNLLIEHLYLRIEMGEHAKENVKRFLPENVMPQWDALFKSLVK